VGPAVEAGVVSQVSAAGCAADDLASRRGRGAARSLQRLAPSAVCVSERGLAWAKYARWAGPRQPIRLSAHDRAKIQAGTQRRAGSLPV